MNSLKSCLFKYFTFAVFFLSIFSTAIPVWASENKVTAYFFYGEGCPHCAKEEAFFESIESKYPTLELKKFEVYYDKDNSSLLKKVGESLGVGVSGVPFLVIGDKSFVGFSESSTPTEIENRIKECLSGDSVDSVSGILAEQEKINTDKNQRNLEEKNRNIEGEDGTVSTKEKILKIPFLGEINIYNFSIPALAVLIGLLDGFNPCAMWVLIFLISLLLGMKDKKRMWILGSAFIVASASVYFIFMAAWLNLILFLGFVVWVRLIIGAVSLIGGGYSLKEFFKNKSNTCKVTSGEKEQRIFDKLKNIVKQNNFWLALGGIILLAFMVNLVELVCSAGLPAMFTQVLAMNNLSTVQYYLYILLYVFSFMLDDLVVFFIAMFTLRMTGLSSKYARYTNLIGGILMVIIGLLLIFRPQVLMFG